MTKETMKNALSRRKLLGRIGVLAAAGYTIPALTTLSMAQAGSGPSGGGGDDGGRSDSASSTPSTSSADSAPSNGPSAPVQDTTSSSTDATALDVCGPENLNDPVYLQCLIDNGFS